MKHNYFIILIIILFTCYLNGCKKKEIKVVEIIPHSDVGFTFNEGEFNPDLITFEVKKSNQETSIVKLNDIIEPNIKDNLIIGRNVIPLIIENTSYDLIIMINKIEVTVTSITPVLNNVPTTTFTFFDDEFNPSVINFLVGYSDKTEKIVELSNSISSIKIENLIIGENKLDITIEEVSCKIVIVINKRIINDDDYIYDLNIPQTGYIITEYIGNDEYIIIPDLYNNLPVVGISDSCFSGNDIIKTVIIKNNIESLGMGCFYMCENLSSVYIPSSVVEINEYALYGPKIIYFENSKINSEWPSDWYDNKNTSIYFNIDINTIYHENDFNYIYNQATNDITITNYLGSIEELNIPESFNNISVTSIGGHAFANCESLITVFLPDTITIIDSFAFNNCYNLITIDLSNSLEIIKSSAFGYCNNLTNITLPNSLKTIEYSVFNSCNELKSIVIPNSVTSIGLYAFAWCTTMTSVYIPSSVISIDEGAFYACSKLTINCELGNVPSTWHPDWNISNRPINWSVNNSN